MAKDCESCALACICAPPDRDPRHAIDLAQIAGIMQQASESIGAAEKHKKLRLEAGYASAERAAARLLSSTASRSMATWVAWMSEAKRLRTTLRRCMLRIKHRSLGPALCSWRSIAMRKKRVENKGRGALARWCARGLGSAWQGVRRDQTCTTPTSHGCLAVSLIPRRCASMLGLCDDSEPLCATILNRFLWSVRQF